jgi:hypothetical protein
MKLREVLTSVVCGSLIVAFFGFLISGVVHQIMRVGLMTAAFWTVGGIAFIALSLFLVDKATDPEAHQIWVILVAVLTIGGSFVGVFWR